MSQMKMSAYRMIPFIKNSGKHKQIHSDGITVVTCCWGGKEVRRGVKGILEIVDTVSILIVVMVSWVHHMSKLRALNRSSLWYVNFI